VVCHRRAIAGDAFLGDGTTQAAEVGDRRVAGGHQVVDDQAHAEVIVVADRVGPQPLGTGSRDHHGHVAEDLREGPPVRDGSDDQHRLDAEILEHPDSPAVDPRARGGPRGHDGTDQQRAEALVLEHLTGPLDHIDQQGVPQVGDQDTDGPRPDIGQRACRQVHPVAELVGSLLDAPPLVLAHHRLAPHHQRHQRLRHPGALGDVADGGPPAVRLAGFRHLPSYGCAGIRPFVVAVSRLSVTTRRGATGPDRSTIVDPSRTRAGRTGTWTCPSDRT
jgi:hypothetical protein